MIDPRTWVKDCESWEVCSTGGCTLAAIEGCSEGDCPRYVKVSPWFEVEDWVEGRKTVLSIMDTAYQYHQAFDSACQVIEEMAYRLRLWQDSGIYPNGVRPGPDWHWIPGHWRRYSGRAATPHVEGVTYHDGIEAFPEPGGLAVCEWEPERWAI